ncbi:MAG: sulfotransferase [bacterium]|nr:sulfotransferase [bacterium]
MSITDKLKHHLSQNRNKYPVSFYNIREYGHWLRNMLTPGYRLSAANGERPFFIIGSGRSGNTLMRAILTAHTDIAIPPESYVMQSVYRKFKLYRFMEWQDLVRIIVADFQSHKEFYTWELDLTPVYRPLFSLKKKDRTLARIIDEIYSLYMREKYPGATIWGDKTPLNTLYLQWIRKIFPAARYIHIQRDGRDVVASYIKTGLITDIEGACHRWNESINQAENLARSLPSKQYMEIKYENLVRQPEKETREICRFLQIEYQEKMPATENNALPGDAQTLTHHQNVANPINTNAIGKWETQLTEEQKQIIQLKLKKNLKKLNYT